jgi:lipopolysaccharide transport system permease protein
MDAEAYRLSGVALPPVQFRPSATRGTGTIGHVTETDAPIREQSSVPVAPPAEFERTRRVSVIRPASGWPHLDVVELWNYRELLFRLAWRDIVVRYKQTSLGIFWAILQPFVTMVVFTLIFGKFGQFSSKGIQYQVFVYSALLPWIYFASATTMSSTCLVGNKGLVTKVYFPRVVLPLAAVIVPLVDFLLAFVVLIGLWFWYETWPSAALVLAPLFLAMALVTALGVGLFLSAVNVRYRDVPYAIPFLMQMWLFVSGVFYAFSSLPVYAQWILALNPMTAVINGFQWGAVGTERPNPGQTLVSVASMFLIFLVGLSYFRRSEPKFADTI